MTIYLLWIFPLEMVISHSYVSLPEGKQWFSKKNPGLTLGDFQGSSTAMTTPLHLWMHAIDGRQQCSQRSAKGEGEFHAPNGAQSVGIDGWQGIQLAGLLGMCEISGFEKGRKVQNIMGV